MSARYIIGDVFDVLATLPDDSVDLVFSSPPFLALRSYLPADHPEKAKEIGSEASPADFLDTLLDVVEACDRVLAPHGSLCFELGDTFSGSGGAGGDYAPADPSNGTWAMRAGQPKFDGTAARARSNADGWPEAKSLCLIPTLFAASLAYGYNMLRPERTTPRWRIRNLVVWARPNPPVGALGDKFRPATSYVTVATKARTRYFDLDAVRGPGSENTHARTARGVESRKSTGKTADDERRGGNFSTLDTLHETNGAPPLDYWVIPTHPYPGSHYATFPPELVVKPVKAMCPLKVCRVCGEPSQRITERTEEYAAARAAIGDKNKHRTGENDVATGNNGDNRSAQLGNITSAENVTVGWTDCACMGDWYVPERDGTRTPPATKYRDGVVLDPFAGSGTTLAVATGHGRDAIGIDLDARNADLALERVGPLMLSVEHLSTEGAA